MLAFLGNARPDEWVGGHMPGTTHDVLQGKAACVISRCRVSGGTRLERWFACEDQGKEGKIVKTSVHEIFLEAVTVSAVAR